MSRINYATDLPFMEPWERRIGQLILNFSGLEFESYSWLIQMSEQPERIEEFTKRTYKQRVGMITDYAKNLAFNEKWKTEAITGWNGSLELAKLRNRIAHNPLMFRWTSGDEKGEPDFIGIVDMKTREQPIGADGPLLSKADIAEAINQIQSLMLHLESLRKDWCALRDKSKGDVSP